MGFDIWGGDFGTVYVIWILHLPAWDLMCRPMSVGGFGVRFESSRSEFDYFVRIRDFGCEFGIIFLLGI